MRWILLVNLFLMACTWDTKKPSFLIIAIDSLPFESIRCGETDKFKGFKIACDEMIRFTHAYTPSTMAQSTLASLLTGKYAFQNGVWNNGSAFLSAKAKTSAELAYDNGYKTLLVSGGPPIWRKSGLDQGFETFDDHIFVDYAKYYRPAMENFRVFQEKLEYSTNVPFFSFIYLADLQFPDTPTIENDGLAREATYSGQLHEIDESLESLFQFLKKNNYWKNTWIIITGLNGLFRESRTDVFSAINLYHENTNVALFIKPPQTQEHQNFSRTVDANISLVDIGRTLFELLDSEFFETTSTLFKTVSLKNSLLHSKEFNVDRILLFETGWPQWRKLGHSQFAFQKENYLMLYESPPKIFNTLVDRNQIYPIDTKQSSLQILTDGAKQLLTLINEDENKKIEPSVIQKYRLAQSFFKTKDRDVVVFELENLFNRTRDADIAGWLARYYIEIENWKALHEIGLKTSQSDWIYVAARRLNMNAYSPSSCIRGFENLRSNQNTTELQDLCSDNLLIPFANWIFSKSRLQANSAKEVFLKEYRNFKTDLDIQRLNMQNGFLWDTSRSLLSGPQEIELILALDYFSKYKKQLDNEF